MTKASEVTVSEAEVARFLVRQDNCSTLYALQEFLAARVPDAVTDQGDDSYQSFGVWEAGHNALRDAVLKGPQG